MNVYKNVPLYLFCLAGCILSCISCNRNINIQQQLGKEVTIFPDYKDVTIPYNIAPLDFSFFSGEKSCLIIEGKMSGMQVKAKDGCFVINPRKWKRLLIDNRGGKIKLTVCIRKRNGWCAYKPFYMYIASDPVDKYIVYRLIPPGYTLWNKMGIYQRCLETYNQSAIYENRFSDYNCVNCHSFCMQNPNKMLFHARSKDAGTILVQNGVIEKLNTKTNQTISALVYPSWHPSGRFIAFSVNKTSQSFHNNNVNRIEVFDSESDVVVYDINTHEVFSSPLLKSDMAFETFPTFSPEGKTLYFCSAKAISLMPQEYDKVHYNLCKISFDPKTKTFGTKVDTVYNGHNIKSVSFPRISPDGKYLVFTLQSYGNFSIWHKDADLYAVRLSDCEIYPLAEANSNDVESYHSWSHNSRWLVFSSRRIDGLYTRPFITYIDRNGRARKPFLLPQKNPSKYYKELLFSYNIPEFIIDKVNVSAYRLAKTLKKSLGINLNYRNK